MFTRSGRVGNEDSVEKTGGKAGQEWGRQSAGSRKRKTEKAEEYEN